MPVQNRSRRSRESEGADHTECFVAGAVVRDRVVLREHLFALLERQDTDTLLIDVRQVTNVDRNAIASLIAANHLAKALGRQLILVDANGPVTQRLNKAHVADGFRIIQDHRDEARAS